MNGSRLLIQTTTIAGDDGSRYVSPGNWYDTNLHSACSPMNSLPNDTAWRCVPSERLYYIPYNIQSAFLNPFAYGDSGCTVPAYPLESCLGTFSFAYFQAGIGASCGGSVTTYVTHVYSLTPIASSSYYTKAGGQCTQTALPSTYTLFRVREMQASEFVSMTWTTQ